MTRTYTLTERQLDMIGACIARANVEGAFRDCVVPTIGKKVAVMIETVRANPNPPA